MTDESNGPRIMRQTSDGRWKPAEPIPFHYGLLARVTRWFTRGRWPR